MIVSCSGGRGGGGGPGGAAGGGRRGAGGGGGPRGRVSQRWRSEPWSAPGMKGEQIDGRRY